MIEPSELTQEQRETVLAVARHWRDRGRFVSLEFLVDELGRDWGLVHEDLQSLRRIDLVSPADNHGSAWEARPEIIQLAEQIAAPPVRDYPAELRIWFRSKRWSVLVLVVFVGLPALYAYAEMLGGLLDWLGWHTRP